jgi:23S rRNA (guanine2445-N2)-methyltransferase / 23S rRNA (guanine2069-N7)-methyltransferase
MITPAPKKFQFTAKTVFGLENVLAGELKDLGAEDVVPGRRLVDFRGGKRLLYRTNLWLRTAIRILKPISVFAAENEQELYRGIREVDWPEYLDAADSLAIDPVVHNSFCTHSLYAAQLAKDAIVDQFRERFGSRPSVDLRDPTLRINLHINENRVTVYLDSSGDSLHKRGYRTTAGEAPLNEVLAAGIIRLSAWGRRTALVDFMCGSGTLPIEAALLARNIAPGLIRKRFAYMQWKDFDQTLHDELIAEARAAQLAALDFPIVGSDLDPQAIEAAKVNARGAGVASDIDFRIAHFEAARQPAEAGMLVFNPPYDERMKLNLVAAIYRRIGDALKKNWRGWTACMLTGNLDAARHIGLLPARKFRLRNGPIDCRLLTYEIFARDCKADTHRDAAQRKTPALADIAAQRSPVSHLGRGAGGEGLAESQNVAQSSAPSEANSATFDGLADDDESPLVASSRRTWQEQAQDFRNRLVRMGKHWKKWARRQRITCFRIYDRDVPEVPLAIDWYEGHVHIAEYVRPHDRTEIEHQVWLQRMIETAADALEVDPRKVALKRRRRQSGAAQYERQSEDGQTIIVGEGGHRFEVNLTDYLDTGLFLDHRNTRSMVEREALGKRVLNLFGYTGTFTVYAAAGGANSTTTVDLSNTYLEWARRNLQLNGLTQAWHQFIRSDALSFIHALPRVRGPMFDLAVVDPPTFSNSKMTENIWDVQRDHVEILNLVLDRLTPGGKVYFSTNFRRFKFHDAEIQGATIREISRQTVPPDFRNKRIHRCWKLIKT